DYAEHIGMVKMRELKRQELAAANVDRVFRHKAPRADDRKGDFLASHTLQPGQGRIVFVAQQHPMAAVFESNQTARKDENIVDLDFHGTKMGRSDLHIAFSLSLGERATVMVCRSRGRDFRARERLRIFHRLIAGRKSSKIARAASGGSSAIWKGQLMGAVSRRRAVRRAASVH